MRKKFLCLLLIFTLFLSALIACDVPTNDSTATAESTNAITKTQQAAKSAASTERAFTYNDIITLYKQIVNLYPSYTEEKMLSDECDGMDAIPDKETKELYKKLFISGYRFYLDDYAYQYHGDGRNYFGYTITDLNQNGIEELILLTDLYNIVAVFSLEENKPKLLLDNYERDYNCRIDEQGRFYTQCIDSSNLYTQIYSLNESDNLVLDEQYRCLRFNYLDHDECYDITSGEEIRIPKSQWTKLTHGWVYGNRAGIITKSCAKLSFTRLLGELPLYLPYIYSWDWSSFQFSDNENTLFISNLTDCSVSLALYDTVSTIYQHKVSVEATRNGSIAAFDTEEIMGRLEFGLDSVWLIIEKSNVSGIPCGAFLYTELSFSKG